jgi:predicted nuclease of predicted toxin-antitoxin system
MKILLDESAPQKLRLLIDSRHAVVTTWFQGWSGLKNGALLAAAEEAGFDLFITADQEISSQQNLTGRHIALLVLSTNNWSVVKEQAKLIVAAIESVSAGSYLFVDIGHGRG